MPPTIVNERDGASKDRVPKFAELSRVEFKVVCVATILVTSKPSTEKVNVVKLAPVVGVTVPVTTYILDTPVTL